MLCDSKACKHVIKAMQRQYTALSLYCSPTCYCIPFFWLPRSLSFASLTPPSSGVLGLFPKHILVSRAGGAARKQQSTLVADAVRKDLGPARKRNHYQLVQLSRSRDYGNEWKQRAVGRRGVGRKTRRASATMHTMTEVSWMTKERQASRRRKTSKSQASRRLRKFTRKECTHPTKLKNRNLTTLSRRVNRLRVQFRISKIKLKTKMNRIYPNR